MEWGDKTNHTWKNRKKTRVCFNVLIKWEHLQSDVSILKYNKQQNMWNIMISLHKTHRHVSFYLSTLMIHDADGNRHEIKKHSALGLHLS